MHDCEWPPQQRVVAVSRVDSIGKTEKDRPPRRQLTPYKIHVKSTYTQPPTPGGNDTSEQLREAVSPQTEALGPYREFEASLQALEWSPSEVHCTYCSKGFYGIGTKYGAAVDFHNHVENCAKIYRKGSKGQ